MLLTLCTNFQVFEHFALQSSPMKLYFWDICLANIFLKSLTSILCLLPSLFTSTLSVPRGPLSGHFLHLKHFEASALLCGVEGMLLDIGRNLRHSLVLQWQISNFPYSLKKICLLCETIFVEQFYTFTKRGTESALYFFSATHSTFYYSAKIK